MKKKVIWIVAAAVALALCLSVAAYVRGHSGSFISGGLRDGLSPLETAVADLSAWLEKAYDYMYRYDSLQAENEQLQVQVAELEEQLRQAESAAAENAQLRELLDLKQKHRDFVVERARIVSWGASNWSSTFTISKGREAGLELGDCVVTEAGCFVGQITELSKDSAVVRTLIDPDTSIGVTVERSGAAGLAQGDIAQMTQGCLLLSYLPEGAQLLCGDGILTAGNDQLPGGLVLGTVLRVETDPGGIRDYAVLQPGADLNGLTQVVVIKDFEVVD